MPDARCATCKFRAKYDAKPQSLLGRLWRWHTNWCPGFKAYLFSLPEGERQKIIKTYGLTKYMEKTIP
jgi:hypothetical protein